MSQFADRLAIIFGTGFFSGYLPLMPGTFGSIIGVFLYYAIAGRSFKLYLAAILILTLIGTWAAARCELVFKEKDSSKIVIDEIAGFIVTMTALPSSPVWVASGFVAFRIFDVLKPPPAGWIDSKMVTPMGVMLDDIIAGIYACLFLHVILLWRGQGL